MQTLAAPALADESASAVSTYATVVVGELQLVVDTRFIVQAIPWPTQMTALPRKKSALEGVFSHRGQIVPLVSLQRWVNPEVPSEPTSQVLVLRADGRVLGLAVDAVRGLLRIARADIHRVHHDDEPEEFFHSVAQVGDKTRPISLLDPLVLAQCAQAWAAGIAPTAEVAVQVETSRDGDGDDGKAAQTFAIVRTGRTLVGFSAASVGEVLPMPKLKQMIGSGGPCLGMFVWRGRHTPVMEARQAIGLPAANDPPAPMLMMVIANGRCLGLPVNEVMAVQSILASDWQPTAAVEPSHASIQLASALLPGGERVLLLDAAALMVACPLSAVSQVEGVTGVTLNSELDSKPPRLMLANQPASQGAHIVFRAGQEFAAPLSQLQEITRFPQAFQKSRTQDGGVLGTLEWRGSAVPLLDLAQASGQKAAVVQASTRVIVVRVNGRLAALVVDDVVALIPAHTGQHAQFSVGDGRMVRMITVGHADQQQSYRVLDFATLAFFS